MGSLDELAGNFEWKSGSTPLSSLSFLIAAIIMYPVTVLCLKMVVARRWKEGIALGPFPAIHNLVLCLGSLWMFMGAVRASVKEIGSSVNAAGGLDEVLKRSMWLVCFPPGTKPSGRLFFWSYMYYLSKFYELIDTLVLVLRNKPLTFLHVYHHTVVIIMCYVWLEFSQSLQTIGLLTNTWIHIIMYLYFFLHSMGMPPPWRKFVTNSQIVQFVFSGLVSLPFLWLHFFGTGCEGFKAWAFNITFNLTLLALFVNFHKKQYGKSRKQGQSLTGMAAADTERKKRR